MTATTPGRGLPPRRLPVSSKSGKIKGFLQTKGRPAVNNHYTAEIPQPTPADGWPNHPSIPPPERLRSRRQRFAAPQPPRPGSPPWLTSSSSSLEGVSSLSLSRSSSRRGAAGSPVVPWPSRGSRDGRRAPSSYGGTCCILFLRTWPKTSRQRRWALPARPAWRHRHRQPSHELGPLAPRWKGQDLSGTGRGSRSPAGKDGGRRQARTEDAGCTGDGGSPPPRAQNGGCAPKL